MEFISLTRECRAHVREISGRIARIASRVAVAPEMSVNHGMYRSELLEHCSKLQESLDELHTFLDNHVVSWAQAQRIFVMTDVITYKGYNLW